MDYGRKIAKTGLRINAIKIRPDAPFTWTSGFIMPIYIDNRRFLFHPKDRILISAGFGELLHRENISYDVIAGTSTAGISPATTLADSLKKPLIYVRDTPKDHGLKNQIEGIDAESDLQGRRVVLVEDLISTGGSSARAVQAIRNANGVCDYCISIFNYDLDKAAQAFDNLDPICNVRSLLRYETLLEVARETGYIDNQQAAMLAEWRADPLGWGKKHGFPKVER